MKMASPKHQISETLQIVNNTNLQIVGQLYRIKQSGTFGENHHSVLNQLSETIESESKKVDTMVSAL